MLNKHKTGLVLGTVMGLWHLTWSLLVVLGLAQPFLNFIFKLHFIQPPYTVVGFNLVFAVELIIVTFILGYIVGWVFGLIWNRLQGSK